MRVRLSTQDITDDALGCDRLPEKCLSNFAVLIASGGVHIRPHMTQSGHGSGSRVTALCRNFSRSHV
jgi:hypothetical protein